MIGAGGALAGAAGHAVVRIPATVHGKQVILKAIAPAALQRARAVMIGRALALKGLPKSAQVRLTPAQVAALQQKLRRAFAAHLPKNMTAAQRAAVLRKFDAATSHSGRVVVNPAPVVSNSPPCSVIPPVGFPSSASLSTLSVPVPDTIVPPW